ncbi:MAG: AAA family ATPase [Nocardioidaceae bacterium]|nr:AAA family ATPase [Nocardioidaceae bacterium]
MRRGRILLLNGASSAGKTSVAPALATCLPTPWLVMPVDLFHSIRSRPPQGQLPEDEWQRVFQRTRSAYHRALAGAGLVGCDVIGDHVLSEPWRLAELIDLTTGVDVLLVHVTCDLDELERRERHRRDRQPGTARAQAAVVFAHGDCDLEVDTTHASPADCGARIAELLASPPSDTAFERLRRGGRPRP